LEELLDANPGRRDVVVDEIQRVPSLLSLVHGLIEERPRTRFVLMGSSARKIRRAGVDLLGGRALLRSLHPFLAAELGERFDLASALGFGMVPLVVTAPNPEETLRGYTALYIREEVKEEGIVRNYGVFSRFLEAVALSHASILNVNTVARDCEAKRNTVAGYISVLEDLLLAFQIPAFTRRAKRALATHPKFYLFDPGVYRVLRPRGPLDAETEVEGPALEGLVVAQLRAWNAYRGEKNGLYHWRTRSGVEVDVVVYGEDGLWAIEVKNRRRADPRDLRSLQTFRKDYPRCTPLLLYRGRDRLLVDGILCMPCEEFLLGLRPDATLPCTGSTL
jgi:predicted AAA+ superfamily ATPase